MLLVTYHIADIFEAFQIILPTASLTFTAGRLFLQVTCGETKYQLRPLLTHNGGCFETMNLPHLSSCEMYTFCDFLHEGKKTQTNSRERAERTGNHL